MSLVTRILVLLFAIIASMLYKTINQLLGDAPVPYLDPEQWWGNGKKPTDYKTYLQNSSKVISNRLLYPESTIEELAEQLNRTIQLTEPLDRVAFEYGFNSQFLKKIVDYWRTDYLPRWREREVFLWQFNHYTTEIQGLRIHFLNLMVYDDNKMDKNHYPVLLLHGWPGSIREFYPLIHKLHQSKLDPGNKYIFNIVVPSLPGYAWSQGTSKKGLGPAQIAVIFRNLMSRLGYEKFFIQGGDWGSIIGSHIATLYPENVIGYHSNLCHVLSPKAIIKGVIASVWPNLFVPTSYEYMFFPKWKEWIYLLGESGYLHLQATKPDTIGSALTGNPIGLAAYILEKFSTWTSPAYRSLPDGGIEKSFKLDALLDNVMIYYLTNSIITSQRLYAEAFNLDQLLLNLDRVPTNVPTGCARFKGDFVHYLDFQLNDKYTNLVHSTYYNEGGHFAALEVPDTLYKDFIQFVKKVEKINFRK